MRDEESLHSQGGRLGDIIYYNSVVRQCTGHTGAAKKHEEIAGVDGKRGGIRIEGHTQSESRRRANENDRKGADSACARRGILLLRTRITSELALPQLRAPCAE